MIWYTAGRKFKSENGFQGAADLTFQAAGELFGQNSAEQQAVQNAWSELELLWELGLSDSAATAIRRMLAGVDFFASIVTR